MCNEMYGELPLDEVLADIALAGYDGVEIAPFTLADDLREVSLDDAKAIGEQVASHGLAVAGLHWLLAQTQGLHLTSSEVEVRRNTADYVGHLAELCSAMGGEVLVWGSPQQRSYPEGESLAQVMSRAVEVLREVCDFAGRAGVTIAMEPLGPHETNFLNTASENDRTDRARQSPRVSLASGCQSDGQRADPDRADHPRQREVHRAFPCERSEPARAGPRRC